MNMEVDERIKFVWRQAGSTRSMYATTYFTKITRNNQGNVK